MLMVTTFISTDMWNKSLHQVGASSHLYHEFLSYKAICSWHLLVCSDGRYFIKVLRNINVLESFFMVWWCSLIWEILLEERMKDSWFKSNIGNKNVDNE